MNNLLWEETFEQVLESLANELDREPTDEEIAAAMDEEWPTREGARIDAAYELYRDQMSEQDN